MPPEGVTVFTSPFPLPKTTCPHLAAQPLSASVFAARAVGQSLISREGAAQLV